MAITVAPASFATMATSTVTGFLPDTEWAMSTSPSWREARLRANAVPYPTSLSMALVCVMGSVSSMISRPKIGFMSMSPPAR